MLPVGFEPMISAGERPQTYTLDRAATGTGADSSIGVLKYTILSTEHRDSKYVIDNRNFFTLTTSQATNA